MGNTHVSMSVCYRQCFTWPEEFQFEVFPVIGNDDRNTHQHYLCPKIANSSTSWLGDGETWFLSGIPYPSWGSAWFLKG